MHRPHRSHIRPECTSTPLSLQWKLLKTRRWNREILDDCGIRRAISGFRNPTNLAQSVWDDWQKEQRPFTSLSTSSDDAVKQKISKIKESFGEAAALSTKPRGRRGNCTRRTNCYSFGKSSCLDENKNVITESKSPPNQTYQVYRLFNDGSSIILPSVTGGQELKSKYSFKKIERNSISQKSLHIDEDFLSDLVSLPSDYVSGSTQEKNCSSQQSCAQVSSQNIHKNLFSTENVPFDNENNASASTCICISSSDSDDENDLFHAISKQSDSFISKVPSNFNIGLTDIKFSDEGAFDSKLLDDSTDRQTSPAVFQERENITINCAINGDSTDSIEDMCQIAADKVNESDSHGSTIIFQGCKEFFKDIVINDDCTFATENKCRITTDDVNVNGKDVSSIILQEPEEVAKNLVIKERSTVDKENSCEMTADEGGVNDSQTMPAVFGEREIFDYNLVINDGSTKDAEDEFRITILDNSQTSTAIFHESEEFAKSLIISDPNDEKNNFKTTPDVVNVSKINPVCISFSKKTLLAVDARFNVDFFSVHNPLMNSGQFKTTINHRLNIPQSFLLSKTCSFIWKDYAYLKTSIKKKSLSWFFHYFYLEVCLFPQLLELDFSFFCSSNNIKHVFALQQIQMSLVAWIQLWDYIKNYMKRARCCCIESFPRNDHVICCNCFFKDFYTKLAHRLKLQQNSLSIEKVFPFSSSLNEANVQDRCSIKGIRINFETPGLVLLKNFKSVYFKCLDCSENKNNGLCVLIYQTLFKVTNKKQNVLELTNKKICLDSGVDSVSCNSVENANAMNSVLLVPEISNARELEIKILQRNVHNKSHIDFYIDEPYRHPSQYWLPRYKCVPREIIMDIVSMSNKIVNFNWDYLKRLEQEEVNEKRLKEGIENEDDAKIENNNKNEKYITEKLLHYSSAKIGNSYKHILNSSNLSAEKQLSNLEMSGRVNRNSQQNNYLPSRYSQITENNGACGDELSSESSRKKQKTSNVLVSDFMQRLSNKLKRVNIDKNSSTSVNLSPKATLQPVSTPRQLVQPQESERDIDKRIHVKLNDLYYDCLVVLRRAGDNKIKQINKSNLRDSTEEEGLVGLENHSFDTLSADVTCFILNQIVRDKKGHKEFQKCYPLILLLHGFIKARDLLLEYSYSSAVECLNQFLQAHEALLEGRCNDVLHEMSALSAGRNLTHPKILYLRAEFQQLAQKLGIPLSDLKVMIVIFRKFGSVLQQIKNISDELTVTILPAISSSFQHDITALMREFNILVWTGGKDMPDVISWARLHAVVEWETILASTWLQHCNKIKLPFLSFVVSYEKEVSITDNCQRFNSEETKPAFTFIASETVTKNAELHYILTSIYGINLIERKERDFPAVERARSSLIVDERTCILLLSADSFKCKETINNITKTIITLSLQFAATYVIIHVDSHCQESYPFRSFVVKAMTRLAAICCQFRSQEYAVHMFTAYGYEQVGETIRCIGETAMNMSPVWCKSEWLDRSWLTPNMSTIILTVVPLSQLLKSTLDQLLSKLTWIPKKVTQVLYSLLHSGFEIYTHCESNGKKSSNEAYTESYVPLQSFVDSFDKFPVKTSTSLSSKNYATQFNAKEFLRHLDQPSFSDENSAYLANCTPENVGSLHHCSAQKNQCHQKPTTENPNVITRRSDCIKVHLVPPSPRISVSQRDVLPSTGRLRIVRTRGQKGQTRLAFI